VKIWHIKQATRLSKLNFIQPIESTPVNAVSKFISKRLDLNHFGLPASIYRTW